MVNKKLNANGLPANKNERVWVKFHFRTQQGIKNLTDEEASVFALIENLQREDLNPIEEALAYKKLLTEFNLKQDEVAERVSKSRTAVTNSMRLLKLDDKIQQMVIDDMISTGHARALLAIEDHEKQYENHKLPVCGTHILYGCVNRIG